MAQLTQGSQVDITMSGDSTLTVKCPVGGFYEVQSPIGTTYYKGSSPGNFDLNNVTVRLIATTRDLEYFSASDPSSSSLTTSQVAALTQRSLSAAQKVFGYGSGGTAIGAGTTIVTQHPAEYPFYGVTLCYLNESASPYTITTAVVASTPTHQDIGNTSTWSTVTFTENGSTVAASPGGAASDTRPSFLLSDMMPVTSVARTDDTTKTPLLQVRSYFVAAANGLSVNASELANWDAGIAAYGRQYAARAPAGDQTATFTASQQPLEAGTWVMPQVVIFHYGAGVKTFAVVGDSLAKGHLTTGGATSWPAIATGIMRTGGTKMVANNLSWTGQTLAGSHAIAKQVISTIKPDVLVFYGWSPNDAAAGSTTQATFDAGFARLSSLVTLCKANGVIPVVCTNGCYQSLDASRNAMRLANNERIKALAASAGIKVIDVASVIDNPTNNAQINPSYNQGDGLHYNDAGHAAIGALAATVLATLY